jgi:hypothetical protein
MSTAIANTAPAGGYTAAGLGANAPAPFSVGQVAALTAAPTAEKAVPSAISPSIKSDPLAGTVVQFLNSQGEVAAQIPSEAALAYLRAGLTADGRKPTEENGKLA